MSELSGFVRGKHHAILQARAKQLRQEMTTAEAILWRYLRGDRLDGLHFRRQQVLDQFIVDFYCHTARLIIEVDGGIHEGQREQDAVRDAYLIASGMRVLRFTNERIIHDLAACLSEISAIAKEQT